MISVKEKVAYGLGDTASNFVFQTVILFLTFYYTDVVGLNPATVGSLFLLVRLIDAVTDPLMGSLADKTRTRWGAYRPYLLWMALPFALISVLAFTTPDADYNSKLIFEEMKNEAINSWHEIGRYGKKIGLKQILWEPMSVGREFGETIEKCTKLQDELNQNSPIPIKICLDVDHGDISSVNSDDYNPYKWLEKFCDQSPVIHLKQSSNNKVSYVSYVNQKKIQITNMII